MSDKTGFKPASDIQGPSEESIRQNELFRNLLSQWDLAVEWAEAKTPEGWSKNIEVSNPVGAIKVTMAPPPSKWEPRQGGGSGFKKPEPAAFDPKKVEGVVMEYPDLLALKDNEVTAKKFLGDLYVEINPKLIAAGLHYIRKSEDGKVPAHWGR